MSQRKSQAINLRMTPELKELLRLAAERERRTLSNMLEVLILDYCQQHGLTAGGSSASLDSASGANKTK
ncbi:hypothetical protein [Paracidovorax konjaci]|uniref:CopG-like RHH_1 or ribbon-helix-helix domain-containing protein, RHH_5 n=1 Tax=Paracidovorax konjaci TaxID=32040 RepID=A0A1I1SQF1_9BURK|nr:hypothetical protein [Paracidovorax konjaci]SFD48666.1 CopG-like RHH_1 or ribbon-helix-helix domain-containing protein, RHH_5 [Paracidovorax konjaci]